MMEYSNLLASIKQTFTDQDQFFFDKHVPEFAKDGKFLAEFDSYVSKRTAAMSAVVLQAIGTVNLADKKVLLFGSGKIATESAKILASELGLPNIDVITRSGDLTRIKAATSESNLVINAGDINNIGQYDIIIAHTQTTEPLFSREQLANIKQGAFLASFDEQDLIYLKDLFTGKTIDQNKRYTVYRSTGTPIQNLAALKLLV